jgi:hypothetical protein
MSGSETHKTVGVDGLVEFGQYLTTLADAQYRHYTFEMPDGSGRLRKCSLDDVLGRFQEFSGRKTDTFRVCIGYVDYQQGAMGHSDRKFTRRKQ